MRKFVLLCLTVLIAAAMTYAFDVPAANKNLGWRPSVTVVKGGEVYGVLGVPIAKLRLFAVDKNGEAKTIPFQIDQCDEEGNYVLPGDFGGDRSHLKKKVLRRDLDNNALDEHDELVFRSTDAGHKAPAGVTFADAAKVLQLELTDSAKRRGWVYLAAFEGEPPPLSKTRYVSYDPNSDTITASNYTARFRPGQGDPFISGLRLTAGDGTDVLDRIKVRMQLKSKVLVSINVSEDDIQGSLAGYIAGPVRVIRSGEFDVAVGGLFDVHMAIDNIFTVDELKIPSRIFLPLSISTVAKQAYIFGGLDMTSAAAGMSFYPSRRTPLNIDGRMDERERALGRIKPSWMAWSGHGASMVLIGDVPPRYKTTPVLDYLDDAQADVGPDSEPGAWGQGQFRYDLMNLKRGVFALDYHLFIFKGTYKKGFEQLGRAAVFAPLSVEVSELPG